MKKVLMCALSALMLVACSSEEPNFKGKGDKTENPSTEVYAMGKQLVGATATSTQNAFMASEFAPSIGYETAYFFIRIDGRIPKPYGSYKADEYWPCDPSQAAGSIFAKANAGKVYADYPYWKIISNDANTKQYLYDSTGKAVNAVIANVPSFESMMSVNKKDVDAVNAIDTKGLKIIWYVAKYTYGKWHVDGVLTYENVDDVTEVPGIEKEPDMDNSADEVKPVLGKGNIEVDVHQQEHKDWQEIKTSVHIRDLVKNIQVTIPIEANFIAESEGFAIRTYDLELGQKVYINGKEYVLDSTKPVSVTIEHKASEVVFTLSCQDEKYLNALRQEYGDGATVEIHTFTKDLTKEQVWARVKNTTVKTNPTTYEGLIFKGATSAYFKN